MKLLLFCFFPFLALAQQQGNPGILSFQLGITNNHLLSFKGVQPALQNQVIPISNNGFICKNGPVFGITYDYFWSEKFSIGLGLYHNRWEMSFSRLEYNGLERITGAGNIYLYQNSVQIRPNYHFIHKNHLNVYSGISLGIGIWQTKSPQFSKAATDDFIVATRLVKEDVLGFSGSGFVGSGHRYAHPGWYPQMSFTLLGIHFSRGKMGFTGELSIGNVSLVTAGVHYRL